MRKNNLKLIIALYSILVFCEYGRSQTSSTFVPKVTNIPSSPEASLLGRFGDIPVGYYTGTANISIPTYTIKENGLEIPITLSYHSSGIKVADEATWVGLGWSLEPGGSIIQEVRGIEDFYDSNYWNNPFGSSPDEYSNFLTTISPHLSGMHTASQQRGHAHKEPSTLIEYIDHLQFFPDDDAASILNALVQGHGQPDLYHYNFAGFSGSFYLHPELDRPVFLKKEGDVDFNNDATLATSSDGTKFYFNVSEFSNGATFSTIHGRTRKLTKIEFVNGRTIDFEYVAEPYVTYFERASIVFNGYAEPSTPTSQTDYALGMKQRLIKITTSEAVINFNADPSNREDILYTSQNNIKRLKSIDIISKISNLKIKTFELGYSYFVTNNTPDGKRLRLDTVKEIGYNTNGTADLSMPPYVLEYDASTTLPVKTSKAIDFYGYYNGKTTNPTLIPDLQYFNYQNDPSYMNNNLVLFDYDGYNAGNRYADNAFAGAAMLKKITYPTKGFTQFEYEPNSFDNQFIPNAEQLANAFRIITCSKHNVYTHYNDYFEQFTLPASMTVKFTNNFSHGSPIFAGGGLDSGIIGNIYYNSKIELTKSIGGNPGTVVKSWVPSQFMTLPQFISSGFISWEEEVYLPYQAGAVYVLSVSYPTFPYNYPNYSVAGKTYSSFKYYDPTIIDTSTSTQCGMRVKSIKSYSSVGKMESHKKINYYEGKLLNKFEPLDCTIAMYSYVTYPVDLPYLLNSIFLKRITMSSDDFGINGGNLIGYGKVEEMELNVDGSDNIGKKTYHYFNEVNQTRKGSPNSPNHRNGQLIREILFNKASDTLVKKEHTYINLSTDPTFRGISIKNHSFGNCDFYELGTMSPLPEETAAIHYKYTYNLNPLNPSKYKLNSLKTTEFYNGNLISQAENYTYNQNGHLKSVWTENSSNDIVAKKYFYAGESPNPSPVEAIMISAKMNGLPLVTEDHLNSELLSRQVTEYAKDMTTSNFILPKFIYVKKGDVSGSVLERRVTHDLYDNKGNLLQYTLENGTPVSIIWGYEKTLPVAKIENKAYGEISTTLLGPIWTASQQNGTESELLAKLEILRNDPTLSGAMVTTYTYKPLVGVSSVTDPKGDKITYHYDSFNRLQFVRDKDGNILSENQYRYRTQN